MRRSVAFVLFALLAVSPLACSSDSSSSNADGGGSEDGGPGGGADASIDDVPDRLTYIDTLTVPAVEGNVPACCYDFGEISKNGVGKDDNAFAVLADTLGSFGVDVQASLDDGLQGGDQVLLLNHVGLTGPDDSFRLDGLKGAFAGSTTYAEASTGTGTFTIDPSSYDGMGKALIAMTGVMTGTEMSAGPDDFSFQIPLGATILTATIKETRITGSATLTETAASYTGGKLSGYILIDELFAGLNAYAATCTCLGLDGDLFVKGQDGKWTSDCVSDAASKCPDDQNCAAVAGDSIGDGQACPLLPTMLQNNADIDLDGDPKVYEGMSVGFEWTGQNAALAQ